VISGAVRSGCGDPGHGQAGQIGADLPEPCRSGLVVAARGGFPGFAASEVAARHPLQIGHILEPGYDFGNEFEIGLSVIVDALTTSIPGNRELPSLTPSS
jgi:hypothetical protein